MRWETQVDDETWILLQRDVARGIKILKQGIQVLERLANRKVVICGGHVITAYRSRPADQKRTLAPRTEKGVGEMTAESRSGCLSENDRTNIASC